MKKILCILLVSAAIIGIQPSFVKAGWLGNDKEKNVQSSVSLRVGFVYRNVVFEKHPLKHKFEGEIKKLQGEHDKFHQDASNNPQMKKLMVEIQGLVDELQKMKEGTEEYKKKEEEIKHKEKGFDTYLTAITDKEKAIGAKQEEFYRVFESDLEEIASQIAGKKSVSIIVSVLARGYDGHNHGDIAEMTPSYKYFIYRRDEVRMIDLTGEFIRRLNKKY